MNIFEPALTDINTPSARNLLIVDDDRAHARLFELLLSGLQGQYRCHHTSTGQNALDFLWHRNPYQDAPRPELILLDLNMPVMDGRMVLHRIKSDAGLRRIPVIMLSTGGDDAEIRRCYSEQANAYIRKPVNYDGTFQMIKHLEQFWFRTATLPR
jgi:two-component system response regulator